MHRLIFAIAAICAFMTAATATAQTPFFWDEFDRTDLLDSKLDWRIGEDDTAVELVDGSVVVTPLADTHPGIALTTPIEVPDFSIRAQVRFHDPQGSYQINPWIGLVGRDFALGDGNSYWAGPGADGILYYGESVGLSAQIRRSVRLFQDEDIDNSDINVQFDAVGNQLSVTSWLVGTEKPETPQITAIDDSHPTGDSFAIVINPSDRMTGFDIRYFAILPGIPGDFSANSIVDATDIDLLAEEIRFGGSNRALDLTGETTVDSADHRHWVTQLAGTWYGDSNLDGQFNSRDFVDVFQAGEYEDNIEGNSTWATGDWNGDAEFSSADIVLASQDGGYGAGPIAAAAVPEPSTAWSLLVMACCWMAARPRASH